jgi:hypothetical protein
MTNLAATERIKRKLDDALDNMHGDLDRVELLAAALSAFSRPVPDYEPRFHHLHPAELSVKELGKSVSR